MLKTYRAFNCRNTNSYIYQNKQPIARNWRTMESHSRHVYCSCDDAKFDNMNYFICILISVLLLHDPDVFVHNWGFYFIITIKLRAKMILGWVRFVRNEFQLWPQKVFTWSLLSSCGKFYFFPLYFIFLSRSWLYLRVRKVRRNKTWSR